MSVEPHSTYLSCFRDLFEDAPFLPTAAVDFNLQSGGGAGMPPRPVRPLGPQHFQAVHGQLPGCVSPLPEITSPTVAECGTFETVMTHGSHVPHVWIDDQSHAHRQTQQPTLFSAVEEGGGSAVGPTTSGFLGQYYLPSHLSGITSPVLPSDATVEGSSVAVAASHYPTTTTAVYNATVMTPPSSRTHAGTTSAASVFTPLPAHTSEVGFVGAAATPVTFPPFHTQGNVTLTAQAPTATHSSDWISDFQRCGTISTPTAWADNTSNGHQPSTSSASASGSAAAAAASVRTASSNSMKRHNLYLGNLPLSWNTSKLREVCAPFGSIVSSKVCHHERDNSSLGHGFILFQNESSAAACIAALHNAPVASDDTVEEQTQRGSNHRHPGGGAPSLPGHRLLVCRYAHSTAAPSFDTNADLSGYLAYHPPTPSCRPLSPQLGVRVGHPSGIDQQPPLPRVSQPVPLVSPSPSFYAGTPSRVLSPLQSPILCSGQGAVQTPTHASLCSVGVLSMANSCQAAAAPEKPQLTLNSVPFTTANFNSGTGHGATAQASYFVSAEMPPTAFITVPQPPRPLSPPHSQMLPSANTTSSCGPTTAVKSTTSSERLYSPTYVTNVAVTTPPNRGDGSKGPLSPSNGFTSSTTPAVNTSMHLTATASQTPRVVMAPVEGFLASDTSSLLVSIDGTTWVHTPPPELAAGPPTVTASGPAAIPFASVGTSPPSTSTLFSLQPQSPESATTHIGSYVVPPSLAHCMHPQPPSSGVYAKHPTSKSSYHGASHGSTTGLLHHAPHPTVVPGARSTESRCNVYINNIPFSWNTQKLKEVCAQFGPIISAKIPHNEQTNASLGYGFVFFEQERDAANCIFALNHCVLPESQTPLLCRYAKVKATPYIAEQQAAAAAHATTVATAGSPILPVPVNTNNVLADSNSSGGNNMCSRIAGPYPTVTVLPLSSTQSSAIPANPSPAAVQAFQSSCSQQMITPRQDASAISAPLKEGTAGNASYAVDVMPMPYTVFTRLCERALEACSRHCGTHDDTAPGSEANGCVNEANVQQRMQSCVLYGTHSEEHDAFLKSVFPYEEGSDPDGNVGDLQSVQQANVPSRKTHVVHARRITLAVGNSTCSLVEGGSAPRSPHQNSRRASAYQGPGSPLLSAVGARRYSVVVFDDENYVAAFLSYLRRQKKIWQAMYGTSMAEDIQFARPSQVLMS